MSTEESPGSPALVHLGRLLRDLRNRAGLTGLEVAEQVGQTQGSISKLETGKRGLPQTGLLNGYLRTVEASEEERREVFRQFELAQLDPASFDVMRSGGLSAKQAQFASLEAGARTVRDFQNSVIPGLLQTPDYARAVFGSLGLTPAQVDDATDQRMRRQVVLSDPNKAFHFVVGDAALFSMHGLDATSFRQQLVMLVARATWPNVEFQILDSRNGWPVSVANPFCIIDRRYVSAETTVKELATSDAREVAQYERAFDELKVAALSAEESRSLLRARLNSGSHVQDSPTAP